MWTFEYDIIDFAIEDNEDCPAWRENEGYDPPNPGDE
jgi:hypothetical protein